MNDLEICKRIAEIEDIPYCMNKGMYDDFVDICLEDDVLEYNPLTDDALAFQLVVKYKVDITFYPKGVETSYNNGFITDGKHLNRGICLTIIAAHED